MIRKLQVKFITIIMLATIIISGIIFGLIIFENYKTIDIQTDAILNLIADNEGIMPEYKTRNDELSNYITKETQFSTRFFTVEVDDNGEIVNSNMKNIAIVSQENVEDIVKKITKNSGFYENFKYKVIQKDNNKMIIFLDCSSQLHTFKSTTKKSILIITSGWLFVFIVLIFLSKRLLQPIIINVEKQKQFITNASHELKTPLAVINADIGVLELTVGESNEWLESIKNQINRLDTLTRSLLNLATVEEGKNTLNVSDFSATDVINEEIKNFKYLLQDRIIVFDNKNDVKMTADLDLIKELIVILLDNAIKYTPKDGSITILLDKQGKSTKLEFSNTCKNINSINIPSLFDRFYRDDASRNKNTEGYGIGLSIAKSIVDAHKGKISSYINDKNMICFKIII